MNKEQLNTLVVEYQQSRNEDAFNEIYEVLNERWRKTRKAVARSLRADEHTVQATYEDALLKAIEKYTPEKGEFEHMLNTYIKNSRSTVYNRSKKRYDHELYDSNQTDDESVTETAISMLPADVNVEEEIIAKEKADHSEVIDSLANGENETVTAIIETFLNHSKPTPTAIGAELGIHHSSVIRTLKRLAGKFDTNKYGEYRDYLLA
jgi:hypothetical protein